jgi:hypothetical protein
MHEYPKALYKPGTAFEWEGVMLDETIVCDHATEVEARKHGWSDALTAIKPPARPSAVPKAELAKFDHGGDGHVGGSLPKAKRKAK